MSNWTCNICEDIWAALGPEPQFCPHCGSNNIRKYAEVVLSREEFKREFVGYLVENNWSKAVAAQVFDIEMDDFAKMETETWGDPAYYWDRDAAREHADDVHRRKD